MSLHHEIAFEREICEHLGANGWLYEEGSTAAYNRELALYPPDLIGWVQEAQPEAWEVLQKNHGAKAEATLLQRVRQQLDQVGTLDLLRHGVEVLGLPKALRLAEFKPAFGLNPAILARYDANRLRVVRQVRYSTRNENCLDLVLFLNGIPVATAELKTDNTQNIADAVWQYKTDRLPKAAGQAPEPLLSFPSGALLPLLEFEREINTVDLSKVVLTHHHLRDLGTRTLDLKQGENLAIPGMAPGGGGVQDKNKVELAEIIAKLNELFSGELGDNDKIPYVCTVIRGKLLESSTLRQQAAANSKQQFSHSPDLKKALLDAIIGAIDAHQLMSTQALNSEVVREGMIDILLNHTNLYEDLRDQGLKE